MRRAYAGTAAAFLTHAAASATWAPRLPGIKASLALSDGELGSALVGLAIGMLLGTRLGGAPVDRWGSRAVMRAGFPLLGAALVLPGLAGSLAGLFAALAAFGLVSGVLDVAMNAQAIAVERRAGHPLVSGLHGLWSVGLGVGAGGAALAAAAGLDPAWHFAIVGVLVAAVSLVAFGGLLAGDATTVRGGRTRWTPALVVLGAIAFCSFAAEGAASDWTAVHLAQDLGTSAAAGAAGFAAFAVAMAAGRFAADPLRARLGAVALVRGGALLAAAGLALGLAIDRPGSVVAGFALLGLGLAPVVPAAFVAAAGAAPGGTGAALSRVATLGYAGTVVGPIAIGWLAEVTTLRAALGLVVVAALAIALAARAVGR